MCWWEYYFRTNRYRKTKKIDKRINKEIYKALNVRDSVERKISEGGTSPKNVLKQASRWIKRLENDK